MWMQWCCFRKSVSNLLKHDESGWSRVVSECSVISWHLDADPAGIEKRTLKLENDVRELRTLVTGQASDIVKLQADVATLKVLSNTTLRIGVANRLINLFEKKWAGFLKPLILSSPTYKSKFQVLNKKEKDSTPISLIKWLAQHPVDGQKALAEAFAGLAVHGVPFTGDELADAVVLFHVPRNIDKPPFAAGSAHAPISDDDLLKALSPPCGALFSPSEKTVLMKLLSCPL